MAGINHHQNTPCTRLGTLALLLPFLYLLFQGCAASDIDFDSLPECGWSACFPYHSSQIGCPELTTDCFCDAKAPVNCTASNCTGKNWYAVEDWFAEQCPDNIETVTLSEIAQCARRCIREAITPKHCEGQLTVNCLCRIKTFFEGLGSCLVDGCSMTRKEANEALAQSYRQTCIFTPNADGSGTFGSDDNGTGEIIETPKQGGSGGLSQAEKMGLYVGIPASVIGVIMGVIWCWVWCHRTAGGIPGGELLDPPPPYTKY